MASTIYRKPNRHQQREWVKIMFKNLQLRSERSRSGHQCFACSRSGTSRLATNVSLSPVPSWTTTYSFRACLYKIRDRLIDDIEWQIAKGKKNSKDRCSCCTTQIVLDPKPHGGPETHYGIQNRRASESNIHQTNTHRGRREDSAESS